MKCVSFCRALHSCSSLTILSTFGGFSQSGKTKEGVKTKRAQQKLTAVRLKERLTLSKNLSGGKRRGRAFHVLVPADHDGVINFVRTESGERVKRSRYFSCLNQIGFEYFYTNKLNFFDNRNRTRAGARTFRQRDNPRFCFKQNRNVRRVVVSVSARSGVLCTDYSYSYD